MLQPEHIHLVQSSYDKIIPIADDASRLFYEHLFARAPVLRPYFPTDLEEQKCKLMSTLQFTVFSLNAATALQPALTALGARHAKYGARQAHYVAVCDALIEMMQDCLGDEFDPATQLAWAQLVADISCAMQLGDASHGD